MWMTKTYNDMESDLYRDVHDKNLNNINMHLYRDVHDKNL